MLIDAADASETRVVVLQNGDIEHFDFISKSKQQIKGNIYLGKITRIEPSLQAAFVEYGGDKQGFLSFSEIHHDYYQIPVEDRKKLQEEMERMAELESLEDDDEDADAPSTPNQPKAASSPNQANANKSGAKPKPANINNNDNNDDNAEKAELEQQTKGKVRRRGGRRKNLNKRNFEIATEATELEENISPEHIVSHDGEIITAINHQDANEVTPEIQQAINAGQDVVVAETNNAISGNQASDNEPHDNVTPQEPEAKSGDDDDSKLIAPIAMSVENDDANLIATSETGEISENGEISEIREVAEVAEITDAKEKTKRPKPQRNNHEQHDGSETIIEAGSPDETEELRRNNYPVHRRYKIQEVLKPGQLVLVQVVKEERGNKGVSVSTYISLAGRYCVVMPNSPKAGGISRKIGSGEDRKRLREISDELKEISGMSAIIRTAGLDRSKAEIKRDYEYLIKLWNQVREDALSSIAPALVYEENDIIKRSIRDHYDGHLEGGVLVQGDVAYRKAKDFMKLLMPSHAPKIKQYKATAPLLAEYGVESMLAELYRPIAPLKSGGYLVLNPTEALVSVDVNSGRSTNEKNVEETAYRTNLEACDELARQLRLRNLGGLIVVDFIDMSYHKYRRNVERALKEALKNDRAKIQIGSISTFGLLELSRQRIGSSLEESTTHACPACSGSGRVPMPEAVALQLLRNLQYFLSEYDENGEVNISLSQALMLELLNNHRTMLDKLAVDFKVSFAFELHPENHDMVYNFKGKGNIRFESTNNNERKGKFAAKNKRIKTRPPEKNDGKNEGKNDGKRDNKHDERDEKNIAQKDVTEEIIVAVDVVATEDISNDEAENIATEGGDAVVKKSRRRGKRGGKNQQRRKLEEQEIATDDAQLTSEQSDEIVSTQQNDAVNDEKINSEVMNNKKINNEIENKDTINITPLENNTTLENNIMITVDENKNILQENQQDQSPEKSDEPKRKGWWQRVLDA